MGLMTQKSCSSKIFAQDIVDPKGITPYEWLLEISVKISKSRQFGKPI